MPFCIPQIGFLHALCLGLLIGCASSPKVTRVQSVKGPTEELTAVLVLPAQMSVRDIRDPSIAAPPDAQFADITRWLGERAASKIRSLGIEIEVADALVASNSAQAIQSAFAVGQPEGAFAELCDAYGSAHVFAQRVRVKIDTELYGRSWIEGRVFPLGIYLGPRQTDLSSSDIRMTIRSCETGSIVWQNKAFVREVPNPQSEAFRSVAENMLNPLRRQ